MKVSHEYISKYSLLHHPSKSDHFYANSLNSTGIFLLDGKGHNRIEPKAHSQNQSLKSPLIDLIAHPRFEYGNSVISRMETQTKTVQSKAQPNNNARFSHDKFYNRLKTPKLEVIEDEVRYVRNREIVKFKYRYFDDNFKQHYEDSKLCTDCERIWFPSRVKMKSLANSLNNKVTSSKGIWINFTHIYTYIHVYTCIYEILL